MSDQTSLDLLNDIVQAVPVGWLPLAPGWYVLGVTLGLAFLVVAWQVFKKWQRNRYRRIALSELQEIRGRATPEAYQELPALLKRTALSVWPRQEVASLSGSAWHEFLDRTGQNNRFCSGYGQVLDRLSYQSAGDTLPSESELTGLVKAAESWLRRHRQPTIAG